MRYQVDVRSFIAGVLRYKLFHGQKINYAIRKIPKLKTRRPIDDWWICLWTPVWHKGRGPYISIGLKYYAFYRGY